jgi:hypothetical protein
MYLNNFTVAGSFALSRAPSGPADVDCFELGSEDKAFNERYAWLVKLSELLGSLRTSIDIEEDHDNYTYSDEYYSDEFGEIMVSNTWKVWFDVYRYSGMIHVIHASKPDLPTPKFITRDFDMQMLCVYVDQNTWQAVEAVPGALEDIRKWRLVQQKRASLDRLSILGADVKMESDSGICKYVKRGFFP